MNNKMPFSVKLLILTAFTVVLWVGFEVYRVLTSEPTPQVPEYILAPLSPTLDISSLNSIGQRINLTEEEIGDTVLLERPSGSTVVAPAPIEIYSAPAFLQPEGSPIPASNEGEVVTELPG